MSTIRRYALLAVGAFSLGLGLVGIFLPVLPTTPFLLVAAACFMRSSERLHRWLLAHPLFGCYIADYQAGRGIPARAKMTALALVWTSIPASSAVMYIRMGAVPLWFGVAALLFACALFATWYLVFKVPTAGTGSCASTPAREEC